jgi:hypothetical protein
LYNLQNKLKRKRGAENKRDKNRRVVRREQNMCKIYYNFKYYLRTSKKKVVIAELVLSKLR